MHLIIIVVALLLERTLSQIARLRRFDAFAVYVRTIERSRFGHLWLARPLGVLVIAPPLIAMGCLQWQIAVHAWLGVQLLFGLAGLLISLGPRDLWEDVYALAHARTKADHDLIHARAVALARRAGGQAPTDTEAGTVLGAVLVQGHERVLAVLMWFVLAGPTGALFYRLVRELPLLAARRPDTRATARTAEYIHGVAAFVPARLTAIFYVVGGRSGSALAAWRNVWRQTLRLRGSASWQLLAGVGRGALECNIERAARLDPSAFNATLLAALSLISRSVMIFLAVVALGTLLALVS